MVKVYENGGLFLEETKDALLKREAACQLILGNAIGMRERQSGPECMFGMVWAGKEPVLAFANCLPWNLLLHSVKGQKEADEGQLAWAVSELAEYLKEQEVPIYGMNASEKLCRLFFDSYGESGAVLRHAMDIMECRSLNDITAREGIYRRAVCEDADWILESSIAFMNEALGEEGNRGEAERERLRQEILEDQIGRGKLRLFCRPDGTAVCMAQNARKLEHGISINQVYTEPEYRGMGYAQTLIYRMCREFFDGGSRFVTLFVDKTNPISNRVYRKVGFEVLEDNSDYRFSGGVEK